MKVVLKEVKMNTNKLHQLAQNIHRLKYKASTLLDVSALENTLSDDLNIGTDDARALLGYLLTRDYVRIYHDMGLVLNPEKVSIDEQNQIILPKLNRNVDSPE